MKNLFLIIFLPLLILSCENGPNAGFDMMAEKSESSFSTTAREADEYAAEEERTEEWTDQEDSGQQDPKVERKIIKTAEIGAEVDDLKKSIAKVEEMIKKHNGFVGNVNHNNSNYRQEVNYTIRVPFDQFEQLMNALGEEAMYLDYKNVRANDVTEEYLDIETRLATKKAVRDRYIEILRNKAKTVQDILMAEERIRVVQEEIESREGRLKYLKNQVSLSTINLHLYQKIRGQTAQQPGFFTQLGRAFSDGWDVFLNLVLGLANIWPIVLLFFLLLYGIRRFWRRKKSV